MSPTSPYDVLDRGHDQPDGRVGTADELAADRSTQTPQAVASARLALGPASRVWPLIAVLGLMGFVVAVVVAGVRNPGNSWLSEGVSGLGGHHAVDPAVMNAGFLALAVALMAAGVALVRLLPKKTGAAASIILIVAGLGQVAVAFVRQDCSTGRAGCVYAEESHQLSASQTVHQVIALGVAAALVLSLWMMATSLRRSPETTALAKVTSRVALASTLVFFLIGSQAYGGYGGVAEKLEIALLYGWPVVLAVALSRQRFAASGTSVWWDRFRAGAAPKALGDVR